MADDILKTLIAEAYGEGPEGMRRVAETILNRSAIRGLTPEEVVRQPKQYTGLNSPGPEAKKAWSNPEAIAAAEAAWQLAQGPDDPTGGADHYYAPGSISQPGWASSMTPKGQYGGHAFFSSRPLPPGELPQVATALSTVPTPPAVPKRRPDSMNGLHPFDASTNTPRPNADGSVSTEITRTVQLPSGDWVNVPSLWWGQGSTVRDFGSMDDDQLADFASRYEKSTGNAFPRYGSIPEAERAAIARSSEGGGTKGPITYPGNLVERSFAKLPKSSRTLADNLAMDPIRGGQQQAPMFDAAYDERTGQMRLTREPIDSQGIAVGRSPEPAPVPALPSPQLAARRATDPTLQAALNARYPAQLPPLPAPSPILTASDRVRGNPMQTQEQATTIASIPTRPQVSASDLARGRSGISTVATYPTTQQMAQAAIPGPNGYINPNKGQERLEPGTGTDPADALLASLGIKGPTQVTQAPLPRPRPDFLPQVATALDVVPMPPMPIPRPPIFANARTAPIPAPRPGWFGIKLPSIPQQMRTVAGRTAAIEPAMRQMMTGSPGMPALTSAIAAQRSPGVSAQQAYERANSAAVERAIAGASNSDAARRLNERLGNF